MVPSPVFSPPPLFSTCLRRPLTSQRKHSQSHRQGRFSCARIAFAPTHSLQAHRRRQVTLSFNAVPVSHRPRSPPTAVFHFLHNAFPSWLSQASVSSPAPGSPLCAPRSHRPAANCLIAGTVFPTVRDALSASRGQMSHCRCWLSHCPHRRPLFSKPKVSKPPPITPLCPAPAHGLIASRLTAAGFPFMHNNAVLSSHRQ